jgi:hypothetical protein
MIIISKSVSKLTNKEGRIQEDTFVLGSTESISELHSFANKIGLNPSWFHDNIRPHYLIFGAAVNNAIKAGAKRISQKFFFSESI